MKYIYHDDGISLPLLLGVLRDAMTPLHCEIHATCPKCGNVGVHRFEPGEDDGAKIHHAAHCECWPDGYYVTDHPNRDAHYFDPRKRLTLDGTPMLEVLEIPAYREPAMEAAT